MSILTIALLQVPWGLLCDRIGFRKTIGITVVFMGIFGILRSFSPGYGTFLISQIMLGVGFAAVMPALPKLVSWWFPSGMMGFATGVYVSGFAVGNMLGLGLTHYLIVWTGGWRTASLILGIWGLVMIVIC